MGMIPAFAAPYVGIPYLDKGRDRAGIDCWGIVRLMLAEVFHVKLPGYDDSYRDGDDWAAIGDAVRAGLLDGWRRVERARAGDLLVLAIAQRPWHCALMLDAVHFLHASPGDSTVVDRLDSPRWACRIEGIYRHD
jgi:cell wall-associated NlpC family hydrolase